MPLKIKANEEFQKVRPSIGDIYGVHNVVETIQGDMIILKSIVDGSVKCLKRSTLDSDYRRV